MTNPTLLVPSEDGPIRIQVHNGEVVVDDPTEDGAEFIFSSLEWEVVLAFVKAQKVYQ